MDLHSLTSEQEIAIFRIVQESVTNTIKYSNGDLFSISIHPVAHVLIMSVSDNGYGFVKRGASEPSQRMSGGFGLAGIEDRVTALGGDFYIDSTEGFNIHIQLPLANLSHKGDDNEVYKIV